MSFIKIGDKKFFFPKGEPFYVKKIFKKIFISNSAHILGVKSLGHKDLKSQVLSKSETKKFFLQTKTKNALFLPDRYRDNFELHKLKSSEFNYFVEIERTIEENQKICSQKNSYEGLNLPNFCHFWAFRSPPWSSKGRGGRNSPWFLMLVGSPTISGKKKNRVRKSCGQFGCISQSGHVKVSFKKIWVHNFPVVNCELWTCELSSFLL